jgi:hypothetical protein
VELYLHSPNTTSWRGAQLGGAQGQLYFYLLPYKEAVGPLKRRKSLASRNLTHALKLDLVEGKAKFSLCLTKHRAIKMYWGVEA